LTTLHYHHKQRQAAATATRREAEAASRHRVELHDLAFTDALTGLPNRRQFINCLAWAVGRSKCDPRYRFAALFLDFDRFNLINDGLGHGAGDEFLIQGAKRMQRNLRPNDVIARLGGDEFAILIQDIERVEDALAMADQILADIRRPFAVAGTVINATASIGVTFSAVGYHSPEEVLRDADIALYRAKAAGKDCCTVFDISQHTAVTDRMRIERDLRAALVNGEIWVAYQPLFNLHTGRLTGFEALARWSHLERGTIGPDVFIPVAEESGLIASLTDLVLDRACGSGSDLIRRCRCTSMCRARTSRSWRWRRASPEPSPRLASIHDS
jgi:diguanylate cyclase (GGDEF)-like protein